MYYNDPGLKLDRPSIHGWWELQTRVTISYIRKLPRPR